MKLSSFLVGVLAISLTSMTSAEVKQITCLSFEGDTGPSAIKGLLEEGAARKDVFVFDTADFAKTNGELTQTMTLRYESSPESQKEYPNLDPISEQGWSKVSKFTATPTHLVVEESGYYGPKYIKVNRSTLMVDMYGEWSNPKPCKIEDVAVEENNVF